MQVYGTSKLLHMMNWQRVLSSNLKAQVLANLPINRSIIRENAARVTLNQALIISRHPMEAWADSRSATYKNMCGTSDSDDEKCG
jgi:hypothetical protein